ncbi:hypothetical protein SNEBB_004997 [Seison nebaliae]|nr:hypothetical protein SNEBB_004997 [Seison nebaliae]
MRRNSDKLIKNETGTSSENSSDESNYESASDNETSNMMYCTLTSDNTQQLESFESRLFIVEHMLKHQLTRRKKKRLPNPRNISITYFPYNLSHQSEVISVIVKEFDNQNHENKLWPSIALSLYFNYTLYLRKIDLNKLFANEVLQRIVHLTKQCLHNVDSICLVLSNTITFVNIVGKNSFLNFTETFHQSIIDSINNLVSISLTHTVQYIRNWAKQIISLRRRQLDYGCDTIKQNSLIDELVEKLNDYYEKLQKANVHLKMRKLIVEHLLRFISVTTSKYLFNIDDDFNECGYGKQFSLIIYSLRLWVMNIDQSLNLNDEIEEKGEKCKINLDSLIIMSQIASCLQLSKDSNNYLTFMTYHHLSKDKILRLIGKNNCQLIPPNSLINNDADLNECWNSQKFETITEVFDMQSNIDLKSFKLPNEFHAIDSHMK